MSSLTFTLYSELFWKKEKKTQGAVPLFHDPLWSSENHHCLQIPLGLACVRLWVELLREVSNASAAVLESHHSLFLSPTGSETQGLIHTPTRPSTVNIASVPENSWWASVFVTLVDLKSLQASFFGVFFCLLAENSKVREASRVKEILLLSMFQSSSKQYSVGFSNTVVLLTMVWYGTDTE